MLCRRLAAALIAAATLLVPRSWPSGGVLLANRCVRVTCVALCSSTTMCGSTMCAAPLWLRWCGRTWWARWLLVAAAWIAGISITGRSPPFSKHLAAWLVLATCQATLLVVQLQLLAGHFALGTARPDTGWQCRRAADSQSVSMNSPAALGNMHRHPCGGELQRLRTIACPSRLAPAGGLGACTRSGSAARSLRPLPSAVHRCAMLVTG